MLLINNDEVARVLTMPMAMDVLEDAYQQLARKDSVCRPRIDIRIPTGEGDRFYQWGTMEGGSAASGYFAIRMKSDVIYEQEYEGVRTQEWYCSRPGKFCGLIWLTDIRTGEPLAIINDGVLQHFRVGADSGIGVKYLAKQDVQVVGMLGSGGMARSHIASFLRARPSIRRVQVYSPTTANREAYADEISEQYGLEVEAVDHPSKVFKGADIVAGCTDSAIPLPMSDWLEPGTHITCVGGRPDEATYAEKVDVYLRLGTAPGPLGLPQLEVPNENIAYLAQPNDPVWQRHQKSEYRVRAGRQEMRARTLSFEDLLTGRASGRGSDREITYSERGNLQGNQFWAVAGKVYEAARAAGLGRELPTEWFLQDIRD